MSTKSSSYCKRIFKLIDITAITPQFSINRNRRSQSYFGSSITIILIGIIITAAIFFSEDMIQKTTPRVITSEVPDPERELPIGQDTFDMSFVMGNPFTGVFTVDPSIYTVYSKYYTKPASYDENSDEYSPVDPFDLQMELCESKTTISNEYRPSGYCFVKNQQNLKTTKISRGVLMIAFKRCDADAESKFNVTCKDSTIIENFFKESYFYYIYTDNIVNSNLNKDPILTQRGIIAAPYNSFGKIMSIYLQRIEYHSDEGWLFNETNTKTVAKLHQLDHDSIKTTTLPGDCFVKVYLLSKKTLYHRSYKKLQDVLAEIAGLFNGLFILTIIILRPYFFNQYYSQLSKQLFTIKHPSLKEQESNKKYIKKDQMNNEQYEMKNYKSISEIREQKIQEKQRQEQEVLKSKSEKQETYAIVQDQNHPIVQIEESENEESKVFELEWNQNLNDSASIVSNTPQILNIQDQEDLEKKSPQSTNPSLFQSSSNLTKSTKLISENNQQFDGHHKRVKENKGQESPLRVNKNSSNDQKISISSIASINTPQLVRDSSRTPIKSQSEIPSLSAQIHTQPFEQIENPSNQQLQNCQKTPLKISDHQQQFTYNDDQTTPLKDEITLKLLKIKAREFIQNECDIINVVKKLIQFERFKNLILTEQQQILFDNLPNVRITNHQLTKYSPKISEQLYKNYEGNLKLAQETFKKLEDKSNLDSIDLILMEAFKQEGWK